MEAPEAPDGLDGLERFDSPGKGRGLRVTRAFQVGELLFSSRAYSCVLSLKQRGDYCESCFSRKKSLARCGKCKKAFYCDVNCQRGDWAMHKLECSAMIAFGERWCPSEITRLVARILTKKKTQKDRCVSERLLLIGEMQSHAEDVDNEGREMMEADVAGLHQFFSKHLEIPGHKDLLTLFSQVACNGFTIEDEELSHLGTAVYPDVALINHSCLPSVIVTYNGTSADVRAVRDMNPGDEVLISYIDVLYPTEDRNTRLRESYYFTCQCQECGSQSSDQAKLKLRKRSDPAEAEVINTMVRYARKCIREFRVFKNSNTPASTLLEMCEQSLDEMGAVFDESNVYMLHMMYQAMGVCLYMQDPDGALRYGEKIAKYYRKLYPAYSLNLSSLYLKLGRLYFGMERNSECISVLNKAKAIMEVTHGKNHFYVTELDRQMKEV